jgi:hypothetical protein
VVRTDVRRLVEGEALAGENRRALGALAAVFPGMRYEVRDGAYQVRAPVCEVVA